MAVDADDKGHQRVFRAMWLLCCHDVLPDRQLGKLGVKVEKCGHANVLALEQ